MLKRWVWKYGRWVAIFLYVEVGSEVSAVRRSRGCGEERERVDPRWAACAINSRSTLCRVGGEVGVWNGRRVERFNTQEN